MNPYVQAGRLRRLHLAPRPDHRYRLHLRLPGRPPGLRLGLLAPMFIIMSFAWGLAVFILVQARHVPLERMIVIHPLVLQPHEEPARHLRRRRALFLVAVYHLTNLYFAKQVAFEHFILVDSGFAPICSGSARSCSAPSCRWRCCIHPTFGMRCGAVLTAAGLVDRRRLLPALCLHHRRPGLPAGHLPRHENQQQLLRWPGRRATRRACRRSCSASAASARLH